jgi:hypothetical protein
MYYDTGGGFPSVIITDAYNQESLSETWANYFPYASKEEAETYFYPLPYSYGFWHRYAESVDAFLAGALFLRDALAGINDQADEGKRYRGIQMLNQLVSNASMVLDQSEDGTLQQEWLFPSLLSCFAVMALQDLTQQRRVLSCDNCNRPFVTEAYQARYCSDKCRRTAQKRRYRKRLKEESGNDESKAGRAKGRKQARKK